MPHNFVIVKTGTADKVGEAATKMGLNGERQSYIPNLPDVLYNTRLVGPTESETIYFTAPGKPGQYPFLCTYPGHYLVMRGVLVVTQ
jgi:azurin